MRDFARLVYCSNFSPGLSPLLKDLSPTRRTSNALLFNIYI